MKKSLISQTKYIAYVAVLVALNALLNALSLPLFGGIVQVTFSYVPCFIAGIFMGPVAGILVGALGDLLGMIIHPLGPWIPLITLANAMIGGITGLIFKFSKLHPLLNLIISIITVFVVATLGVNTYALYVVYAQGSKTFWVYLLGRIPTQSVVYAVNGTILYALYYPLKKTVFKNPIVLKQSPAQN